jgi:hypothetical protein
VTGGEVASQFLPFIAHAGGIGDEPRVYEATYLSTDTSQPFEFVFFDTTDNNVKVCGADPALILGLCLGNAPGSTLITPQTGKPMPYAPNKVPTAVISADTVIGLSSTTTPSLAFVTRLGGLTKVTSGGRNFWQCDTTKTGATARFVIVDVDIPNGIFYVRFRPQYLQGQSVIS